MSDRRSTPSGENDTKAAGTYRLQLLGEFRLLTAHEVLLPSPAQRLVARLALRDVAFNRRRVANSLWLDIPEERAFGNLRSTLWRLGKRAPGLIECQGNRLCISPLASVDMHEALHLARALISGGDETLADGHCGGADVALLSADLLPDWSDEWVIVERERVRQVRLHALEALCRRLIDRGDYCTAVEAGLAAVAGEPLRESANRVLVEVHLREGNLVEALRQYRHYRTLLRQELGVEPSQALAALVQSSMGATDVAWASS
jgi:DNA-binding SARP family transcriptional activator